jgi:hypothetical protein
VSIKGIVYAGSWRILDGAAWLSARPRLLFPSAFAFLWLAGTLASHYVPKSYNDKTYVWGASIATGLFVAIFGTVLVSLLYYRGNSDQRDDAARAERTRRLYQ